MMVRNALEFLNDLPNTNQIKGYMNDLTEERRKEFDDLLLFIQLGMNQLANKQKLIPVGYLYFTYSAIATLSVSILLTIILNRLLFQFPLIGFILLGTGITFTGISLLIFVKKHQLYVNRIELWRSTLSSYIAWYEQNPDEFDTVSNNYTNDLSDKKKRKMVSTLLRQH